MLLPSEEGKRVCELPVQVRMGSAARRFHLWKGLAWLERTSQRDLKPDLKDSETNSSLIQFPY